MLKLIDGLEAMSRNRDLAVACRQYLTRYPKTPQTADITRRLAYTLEALGEYVPAAEAYKSLWEMQPNANGRDDGYAAVRLYTRSDKREDVAIGCELAEAMFDRLGPSPYTERILWHGFFQYRRFNEWAKANVVGRKMLAKNLPRDAEQKHTLHRYMAENFANQAQYTNAVESYQAARKIRQDDQNVHYYLIERMHNATMSAAQMAPVVDAYMKTYSDRFDRFSRLGYLGYAYLRDGDKIKARQIFQQTMAEHATIHSVASQYISTFGTEPAEIAAAEKGLQDAIKTNKYDAYYLQYLLGFTIYRDR
ncbi:MAG: hypothetical protein KDA71_23625, partial [Planctomycetales bacterium]|nr:hypothetical protein [Planctomycetales bacterium]